VPALRAGIVDGPGAHKRRASMRAGREAGPIRAVYRRIPCRGDADSLVGAAEAEAEAVIISSGGSPESRS